MITRRDVENVQRLARIQLTEAEAAKLEKELSAILDFVAKLSQVDTSRVEPLTGGTELKNAMREDDRPGEALEGEAPGLVAATPRQRRGYVEVRAVFERA